MSHRPRVVISVTYGFSVRYLWSTGVIEALSAVCEPVVALGWDDEELVATMRARGVEVVRQPDARLDHAHRMYRRRLEAIHQQRLRSPSTAIERRQRQALAPTAKVRAMTEARRLRDRVVLAVPGQAQRVEAGEAAEVARGTNVAEFAAFLHDQRADLLLVVTPYHDQDTLLLDAAATAGVPSLVSVISFDNPTTRRGFPVSAEQVLVWNQFNEQELLRSYPTLRREQIQIIGAPQFDLHHRPELVGDEASWRMQLGLPADRPVILYGGGPAYLVPEETRLVRLIDDAIASGRLGGRPFLLARRHPADHPEPWRRLSGELRHGVVTDPWAPGSNADRGWPSTEDLELQMSSLAHSAVHVNVCSSMTLDGAMFDRPQIGPRFVPDLDRREARRVRDLYEREHWWPITRSGGLHTVDSPEELIRALDQGLTDPAARHAGRRRMVEELLTIDDGAASTRLIDAVAGMLEDRQVPAGGNG